MQHAGQSQTQVSNVLHCNHPLTYYKHQNNTKRQNFKQHTIFFSDDVLFNCNTHVRTLYIHRVLRCEATLAWEAGTAAVADAEWLLCESSCT